MDKKKFPVWAVILCVLLALLSRTAGVIYSSLATNVVYADTLICSLLPAIRQLLSDLSFALAAGAVMACFIAKVPQRAIFIAYTAIVLADGAAVIIIDVISGVFENDPARLFMGIGYRLGLAAYFVFMLFIGTAIAKAMLNRGGAVGISTATAATLPVAIDLISVMWTSIASLIEWEFMPMTSEIYTILYELGAVILSGVLSAAVAIVTVSRGKK